MNPFLTAFLMVGACLSAEAARRVVVTHDDTVIRESCDVVIPEGTVISDANTNGVIRVEADGITIRFAEGSVLRGASPSTPWDALRGIGIRVEGRRGVRIVGARVHGFFNGLVASKADRLEVEGGDYSDNFRQRLRSGPEAESGEDWLFPHHNDDRKWRNEYGGAVCIEDSSRVTLRGIRVRRGQNGILLDRVNDSRVFDNDASFLSGWGLALWRSSRNLISRNAFDFCVRGHVEGVYNRGQDSAGILCFEQCNENRFIENSATHGGDGFFGFAGREAIGEAWVESERERLRRETGRQDVDDLIRVDPKTAVAWSARGCNRNVFVGNDFSYASAHGIEMTFSEGNVFRENRVVENAICGFWGGYSSDTWIVGNDIARNGGMAYGLERGGINMEHASGNRIFGNRFSDNKCAIHLWWDRDEGLLRYPGVAGNARGVRDNVIASNRFEITAEAPFAKRARAERLSVLQLRDDGTNNVRDNLYFGNVTTLGHPDAVEFDLGKGCGVVTQAVRVTTLRQRSRAVGNLRPVGARAALRGREHIVMGEWGPWDHESPMVRTRSGRAGERVWEVLGLADAPRVEMVSGAVQSAVTRMGDRAWRVALSSGAGVASFEARVTGPGLEERWVGTLIAARWSAVFFPWTVDPREDLAGWRAQASGPTAVRVELGSLDFPYGWGGPRDQALGDAVKARAPGGDRFGMVARTRLALPKGRWKFTTLSDDGVRVRVSGTDVIENWTWHGPTPNEGVYEQASDGEVEVEVEHFEIDGYAVLKLGIEREEGSAH